MEHLHVIELESHKTSQQKHLDLFNFTLTKLIWFVKLHLEAVDILEVNYSNLPSTEIQYYRITLHLFN